jgi:hypothetical protein
VWLMRRGKRRRPSKRLGVARTFLLLVTGNAGAASGTPSIDTVAGEGLCTRICPSALITAAALKSTSPKSRNLVQASRNIRLRGACTSMTSAANVGGRIASGTSTAMGAAILLRKAWPIPLALKMSRMASSRMRLRRTTTCRRPRRGRDSSPRTMATGRSRVPSIGRGRGC